jgi:hypothetical protein
VLKLDILASLIYTRSNPNTNPPIIVSDHQNIGRKSKVVFKTSSLVGNQSEGISIPKAHSFPKGLENLQDIDFDINFEQSLFCSKYLSWIDEKFVDSSISLHNPVEDQFSHS